MVQESDPDYAVVKGALIKPAKEECALGMVQWSADAELKDALIKLAKEECAGDMGQDIKLQTQMNLSRI